MCVCVCVCVCESEWFIWTQTHTKLVRSLQYLQCCLPPSFSLTLQWSSNMKGLYTKPRQLREENQPMLSQCCHTWQRWLSVCVCVCATHRQKKDKTHIGWNQISQLKMSTLTKQRRTTLELRIGEHLCVCVCVWVCECASVSDEIQRPKETDRKRGYGLFGVLGFESGPGNFLHILPHVSLLCLPPTVLSS